MACQKVCKSRYIFSNILHFFDILPTCDCFIYLKDNLASRTLSISAAVLITSGLTCETKPTICKHRQKQMQPYLNRHELVQKSLTTYKHLHYVPHTEHVESSIRQNGEAQSTVEMMPGCPLPIPVPKTRDRTKTRN